MDCIASGTKRIRIDFDTSIGDQTYTSIKNTIPMVKEFSVLLSQELDLTMDYDDEVIGIEDVIAAAIPGMKLNDTSATSIVGTDGSNTPATGSTTISTPATATALSATTTKTEPLKLLINKDIDVSKRTMRIFFPDMGQAALARRDWKMGTDVSEVPPCVYTANIKNDDVEKTDKVAIILCPLSSEVDSVKRLMDSCTASNVPLILINPDLINMDQGFGFRARNLRKDVLGTFLTSYKLKTTATGALVREWPKGFSGII